MKVAYDHQAFVFQRYGGVSRYFVELIRGLMLRQGIDPTVIAPFYLNEYLRALEAEGCVRGRYVSTSVRGSRRMMGYLNSASLPLVWAGKSFDIVHETYYSNTKRGRCRARVITVYDMILELFSEEFTDAAEAKAEKRSAIQRADHVICISETTRQDAIRILNIDPSRSSVIYLGGLVTTGSQSPSPAYDGRPYVLYVGHRGGYKNFDVLVRAFSASKLLRDNFDLVAFGGSPFSVDERTAIEKACVGGQVRHMQGSDELLKKCYRAASVFVYPSKYEGFGIPPLEAMANECPIVCSNAGSIAEIVGDGAEYFAPDNAEQLQVALERVVSSRGHADDLRSRGRARVQQYSWDKCSRETSELYHQLI